MISEPKISCNIFVEAILRGSLNLGVLGIGMAQH